jgi:SP family facilitated glucose transporter-like MFS transporter 3
MQCTDRRPRFLIGIGAGLGLCVIPPFLSEISPPKIRDAVGILNQLAVVIGILVTQVLGFYFARPGSWRTVFVVATGLSVLQFILGTRMVESPAWLAANDRRTEAKAVSARLWRTSDGDAVYGGRGMYDDDDVEEALLRQRQPLPTQDQPPATIGQCLRKPELRRPLLIVSLAMTTQQVCGKLNRCNLW